MLVAGLILALFRPSASIAQPTVTVLHPFADAPTDGARPRAPLIQANDGNFYGTTVEGGAFNLGTVFRMTPTGDVTVLHAFAGGTDGSGPNAALTQATDGNLYGTTFSGGGNDCYGRGCGTVFRLSPAGGTVTVLHAFTGGTDGSSPYAALTQATDGNFYGTTLYGGAGGCYDDGCGTVFRVTPGGTVTVLHAFDGGSDGLYPIALIQATDGDFYGTTSSGGDIGCLTDGCGTVFRLTSAGTLTILHRFASWQADGAGPTTLIQAADGDFYGTTQAGGFNTQGTVYRIKADGAFTSLFSFSGALDGSNPNGALVQGADGNFYGTTYGGSESFGTVFTMNSMGSVASLHIFSAGTDGANPAAALVQGSDGALYGTIWGAAAHGVGGVFRIAFDQAPTITIQPRNQRIRSGLTATLSVAAWGSGLTYQWYSGTTGTTASPIAGATASIFNTPALTGTTSYWVRVSIGARNADSNTVTVIVGSVTNDFDGDGQTDLAVYRESTGQWFILQSSAAFKTYESYFWGISGDTPVPGDYDGDGKTDIAMYRAATGSWYILLSSSHYATYASYGWGVYGDVPVPGDYDGDGKTDIAVYRPVTGTWYVLLSSTNFVASVSFQWGLSTDVPVPADYDGDSKTDVAVYRAATGTWYILLSSTHSATFMTYQFGAGGDLPVPADYDTDGKTDVAVYRPSTGSWYILGSSNGSQAYSWGAADDVPLPIDFDRDGRADLVVYRPSTGTWFILKSSTNYVAWTGIQWGTNGDLPLLKVR
jgi:uncharacterized repeat protein (TIGR03803 family)